MTYAPGKYISALLALGVMTVVFSLAPAARAQTPSPEASTAASAAAAARSAYGERVARYIRPSLNYSRLPDPSTFAVVEIKIAPTGTVLSYAITSSSGDADWNDAVLRALSRTPQLPRDVDGSAPPTIRLMVRSHE